MLITVIQLLEVNYAFFLLVYLQICWNCSHRNSLDDCMQRLHEKSSEIPELLSATSLTSSMLPGLVNQN